MGKSGGGTGRCVLGRSPFDPVLKVGLKPFPCLCFWGHWQRVCRTKVRCTRSCNSGGLGHFRDTGVISIADDFIGIHFDENIVAKRLHSEEQ